MRTFNFCQSRGAQALSTTPINARPIEILSESFENVQTLIDCSRLFSTAADCCRLAVHTL